MTYLTVLVLLATLQFRLHPAKDVEKNGAKQCYICQSVYQKKPNVNCPGDDYINRVYTYKDNCTNKCYIRTNILFKGIFRGCTDNFPTLPKKLPKDGCYKYYLDTWCICKENLCNTGPLGKHKKLELDYRETTKDNSAPRRKKMLFPVFGALFSTVLVLFRIPF